MPLTDVHIKNAKPVRKAKGQALAKEPDAGSTGAAIAKSPKYVKTDKPYKLADANGLYIEIDPSEGKYWRFKYRFGGKEIRPA